MLSNICPQPVLIILKLSNIAFMFSSLAPKSFNLCVISACKFWSILWKVTLPASSSVGSPDNNKSFSLFNVSFLCLAVCLFATVLHAGKIASMFVSKSLETCLANSKSNDLLPICCLSISKNSWVFPPRALT